MEFVVKAQRNSKMKHTQVKHFVFCERRKNTFCLTEGWKAVCIRRNPMHLVYFRIITEGARNQLEINPL